MTSECGLGESLDAELARRVDAEGRIAESLVDLERHPGHRLLSVVTPTGRTAERWAEARCTLAELWQDFETYRGVVATARAVRARRSRLGPRELAELHRLLVEPSIEVARTATALPERRLTGAVERVETITLEQLITRMDTAFVEVSEFVVTCDAVHQAFLRGLAPLGERLQAARGLVGDLAADRAGPPDPEAATVAALTARIAELDSASATDPLALAGGPPAEVLAALEAEVAAASGRLAGLAALRDSWDDLLGELRTILEEISRLRDEVEQVQRRALELIDSAGLAVPPDRLPALRAALAALGRPAHWPARAEALADLRRAADEVAAELRAAHEVATGLLDRRAELRGRFDAYRAKATRLGHAEHPELLALDERLQRLLWTQPCDLAAATRELAAYRRLVTGPGTPGV